MTPIHVKIRVTRINPICCFEKVLQLVQGKFPQLNGACTIFLPAFLPQSPEHIFNSIFFFLNSTLFHLEKQKEVIRWYLDNFKIKGLQKNQLNQNSLALQHAKLSVSFFF